jgi:uncharacterized protein YecT (DUF1311 family)
LFFINRTTVGESKRSKFPQRLAFLDQTEIPIVPFVTLVRILLTLAAAPSTSSAICENIAEFQLAPCLQKEVAKLDAELNRTYKALLISMSPDLQKTLRESERAWIRCRDADLALFASFPHGNHPTNSEYREEIGLIQARIDYLKSLQ